MKAQESVEWKDTVGEFEVVTTHGSGDRWITSIYLPRTAASSVAPVRRLYSHDMRQAREAHKFCVNECKIAYKEQKK